MLDERCHRWRRKVHLELVTVLPGTLGGECAQMVWGMLSETVHRWNALDELQACNLCYCVMRAR